MESKAGFFRGSSGVLPNGSSDWGFLHSKFSQESGLGRCPGTDDPWQHRPGVPFFLVENSELSMK